MEELSIKVSIANRYYPITATAEEEETIRKAAKLVNDKLKHLQQLFAVKDMQDMLAMVSLDIATTMLSKESADEHNQAAIDQEISKLQQLLASAQL